jgi:RNA polymerase sigma-70 factor, ECF subfamily
MTAEDLIASPIVLAAERTGPPSGKSMDEAKFDAFYRASAAGLWSYLHRMTGDGAVADDLLQKAFLRMLRADPKVESDEHLRRWLYKTATNLAMDHFRETKRRRERTPEPVHPAPRDLDLRHDVKRIFSELKPRERALLWLAHVEQSDHIEIGDALGVKAKSVKVLLFRARKRLTDMLKQRGIGPEALR